MSELSDSSSDDEHSVEATPIELGAPTVPTEFKIKEQEGALVPEPLLTVCVCFDQYVCLRHPSAHPYVSPEQFHPDRKIQDDL